MIFRPAPFPDGRRGLLSIAVLLLVSVALGVLMAVRPIDLFSFLLLVILLAVLGFTAYVAWRTWLCLSLAYWVDRNAVTVAWGPLRQVIPLGQIERVVRGGPAVRPGRLERWPWLHRALVYGPELNAVREVEGRRLISLASRPLAEQLLLETTAGAFGISPADGDGFLLALEQHHRLGPTRLLRLERRRPRLAQAAFWRDRPGQALVLAGFLGGLLVLGVLMARYPLVLGQPREGGLSRAALLGLPAFALAVWLVNGLWGLSVHGQQRIAAYLLWIGTLVVQAATLAALLTVMA